MSEGHFWESNFVWFVVGFFNSIIWFKKISYLILLLHRVKNKSIFSSSWIDFYCILNMYSAVYFISLREWRQMFLNLILFCIRKKTNKWEQFHIWSRRNRLLLCCICAFYIRFLLPLRYPWVKDSAQNRFECEPAVSIIKSESKSMLQDSFGSQLTTER